MDEVTRLPRLEENMTMEVRNLLAMQTVIEHRRSTRNPEGPQPVAHREMKHCVQVELWIDDDGHESIVVQGDETAGHLELKGLLHDGIYALAHEGERGFVSPT
jgi:hypothetical protein